MKLSSSRSTWRVLLMIIGLLVLLITVFYSNHLAQELSVSEQKNLDLYIQSVDLVANDEDLDQDMTLQLQIINSFTLPVITRDENGAIRGYNWPDRYDNDEVFLKNKIKEFEESDKEPIRGPGYLNEVFYFDTPLYVQIKYFPMVQAALIALFVGLAYFVFSSNRRAEQNLIWAGMAKETAHQLGTPISGIMAWIQYLKEFDPNEHQEIDVIKELENDVTRLELIADRFSKIGSVPELERTNIYDSLDEIEQYMKHRAPKKILFDFPRDQPALFVKVNKHLFSWVLENIIRNALDAMDGKGVIKAEITILDKYINLDISDTGHGIPASKFKNIFKPGYSTKKRGWGLGLSLAERIIEEYHKGKISVKSSKINEGTTFALQLPRIMA